MTMVEAKGTLARTIPSPLTPPASVLVMCNLTRGYILRDGRSGSMEGKYTKAPVRKLWKNHPERFADAIFNFRMDQMDPASLSAAEGAQQYPCDRAKCFSRRLQPPANNLVAGEQCLR